MSSAGVVSRVVAHEWQRLRDARLAALADSPDSFGSTLAKESAFDEEEWRRRAIRPATFIAAGDGRDIGMAGVYESDAEWFVAGMWIAPFARGTGVVDKLICACESVPADAGAALVALWVMEDNPRAQRAYIRLGYDFTGAREHVRDGRHELLMIKNLH